MIDSAAILSVIPRLAQLRISVFREFPYLYDGDLGYEANYLELYAKTKNAAVVVARDHAADGHIIGAATSLPLEAEHAELLSAFHEAGIAVADYYYFAESVLEPDYRGRGIGHTFFDHREAMAEALGYANMCFLSVVRPADHSRRPQGYRSHDKFWTKRGYSCVPDFRASFTWKDLDDVEPSAKPMDLWQRSV